MLNTTAHQLPEVRAWSRTRSRPPALGGVRLAHLVCVVSAVFAGCATPPAAPEIPQSPLFRVSLVPYQDTYGPAHIPPAVEHVIALHALPGSLQPLAAPRWLRMSAPSAPAPQRRVALRPEPPSTPPPAGAPASPPNAPSAAKPLDIHRTFFAFDSAALTDTANTTLRSFVEEHQLAGTLATHGLRLSVEGHTDSVGSDTYNRALGQRRANAVREALVRLGVAPDRIDTATFGKSRPIAENTTDLGRQQNRRAELIPPPATTVPPR